MEMLWLGEPACGDPTVAGGKAAGLSRLAASHRIPPGFCIPASIHAHGLMDSVAIAYRALAERCGEAEPAVAVRSSATDEDGATASFAGQYETVLNVRGVEAVVEAVLSCWSAAGSARLREYRQRHGLPAGDARLPILVQQLIHAEVSAVAFSANPVTGNRGETVINASWGLGESVVNGSVTPDSYVVRRSDGTLLQRHVAPKHRMTVPVHGGRGGRGGTREIDVPPCRQQLPALDDHQIAEIARLATSLDAELGAPVDVECAYADGTLYLLQCRPITTLR